MSGVESAKPSACPRTFSWKTVLGMHYIWREKWFSARSRSIFLRCCSAAPCPAAGLRARNPASRPMGLGMLRCAPGIGAAAMALLAYRPLRGTRAARCCGASRASVCSRFCLVSHSLALSMIALILVGATDMVSVVVRGILIQLATPDEMRGRVNAVDMIFIGASNEFGRLIRRNGGVVRDGSRGRHRRRRRYRGYRLWAAFMFPNCGKDQLPSAER